MSQFRIYIKPFNTIGEYVANWTDVTSYVNESSISALNQTLDNDDFNVGLFNYNDFSLKFDNESGLFSDVDVVHSMFRYKRSNSLVKITWSIQAYPTQCGTAECGYEFINPEVEIFTGLINDESSGSDISDQKINFSVLGRESIFSKAIVPFTTISAGDYISAIIYKILNQAEITSILTISAGNINPGIDFQIDSITDLQNKTVKETLDNLLLTSSSVLYVKDGIVYVTNRDETLNVMHTFYGQASNEGIEDIESISNIRSGINRVFNFWTWRDTTLYAEELTSTDKYGYRKKEIDYDSITNGTKRQNILNSLRSEFGSPKQELELTTLVNYDTLQLFLFDKVNVDYPTVLYAADENIIPIWGAVKWGAFKWPFGEWGLTLNTSQHFKIMGKKIDMKKHLITFKLRAI